MIYGLDAIARRRILVFRGDIPHDGTNTPGKRQASRGPF